MLKKRVACLLLIMLAAANICFAEVSIKIEQVTMDDVKRAIFDEMKDFIPDSKGEDVDAQKTKFFFTESPKVNDDVWTFDTNIEFVQKAKDKDVILSARGNVVEIAPTGARSTYKLDDSVLQANFLEYIKARLKGAYRFGFRYDIAKDGEGAEIESFSSSSPMPAAGVMVGDIVTAVNGKAVRFHSNKAWISKQLIFDIDKPQVVTFTIKRAGIEKDYVVASVFSPPVKKVGLDNK